MLNSYKIAILIGVYIAGALSGWVYEHDKLIALTAEVKGQAEIQQQIIAKNEEWNKQVIKESTNEYEKQLNAIKRTTYRVRNNDGTCSAPDSNSAGNTSGTNGTTTIVVPNTEQMIKDCAATTEQLITLQNILKSTKE